MRNLNKEVVNKTYSKIKVMQFGEGNFFYPFSKRVEKRVF